MRSSGYVAANPPPMLLREGVVGACLLDCRFHQLGGPGQAQATQLLDYSDSLLACRRDVLAGAWIALSMAAISRTLVEGT